MAMENRVKCLEEGCAHEDHYLGDHLLEVHGLTVDAYLAKHPGAATASKELLDAWENRNKTVRRAPPPVPSALTIQFAGVTFPVNADVPASACLPLPDKYRCPEAGKLGKDVQHAAVALARGRSTYIWGLPGSGKDAFIHALSALTRTPAVIMEIAPGVDIQSWFFSRGFDATSTRWEEGELLRVCRDGYTTSTGRRIPYIVLVSDIDRADRSQAEHMRLITDSIKGRVKGPGGVTYDVFPGTVFVATANSAGSGDNRGRCISSNPIDASLLDRWERKFEFRWMEWKDEEVIVRDKFPLLVERCPEVFARIGAATAALRQAILKEELYAEFSHRALCAWLGHAEDYLTFIVQDKPAPENLLKKAARAWLDGLPDEETRESAKKLIDPHLKGGMLDAGTGPKKDGELADGWG